MHRWLFDLLICPDCADEIPLQVKTGVWENERLLDGLLNCPSCGNIWPVRKGVPRFVPEEKDYAGGFGFQWQRWRHIQIDRLNGTTLTTDRLLTDTGWDRDWISGKLIFDGGAGAGRFSDAFAAMGARVVALDMSIAVDACRETTGVHGDAVQCLQASLYAIPLRSEIFDAVHCAGVIQHTPDPELTMRSMPRLLKPGAPLGYNFYERTLSRRMQILRAGFRLFTPYLSQSTLLKLCLALVVPLFPVSRTISRIRFIRFGIRFLPICASHQRELSRDQQFEWTLLDTFDWYNPRFDQPQRHTRAADILADEGLTDVVSAPGIARARRPPL
ncbi:MAG: methyltransferase domain-containing protein [Pseudomonadota bacterium]|nr:methyltransferase domain-containing protein [Pseudomonadota bacterium]